MSYLAMLLKVATAYGVAVEVLDDEAYLRRVLRAGLPESPGGDFGIDMDRRTVCVSHKGLSKVAAEPEMLMHEITHVICQPPRKSIWDVSEWAMLLPFERVLARSIASRHMTAKCGRQFVARVISFQGITEAYFYLGGVFYDLAGDIPNLERRAIWRLGLARARKLGLLDRRNRVTWRSADWTRISNTAAWRI